MEVPEVQLGTAEVPPVAAAARPGRPGWSPAGLAWALWVLTLAGLLATAWLDRLLRLAGRPELASLPAGTPLMVAMVAAATVGAVLAGRRPRHPVGWLLLALGLSLAAAGVATGYASYGLLARPGGLPAATWAAAYHNLAALVLAACLGFILLLTPTGSLPSPRWRRWARVSGAAPLLAMVTSALLPFDPPYRAVANPLAVPALAGPLEVVGGLAWAATGAGVLVGAASLVVRFRRARGLERQQLRWVALAAALTGGTLLVLVALIPVGDQLLLGWLAAVCLVLLPLATGAAILRYRLYDLDYIISRAVVYGLLTAGGVVVYVAVVVLAEWLLREGLGLGSRLLATAVITAGFAPAVARLQRRVDRLLYGERHDPARAVARLGERLRDAHGGVPGGDALAGVLQGVCESLRLPSASLHVDGVEVAACGRPGAASEAIPLEHEGQRVGELLVGLRAGERALGVADRQVLGVLAAPVAVALHAVLLSQELARSQERLLAAREEERRRLRRDLHDGLGPILTAVTLKADAARGALEAAPERTGALLAELRGDAWQAIGDLRRVVDGLRPAPLGELGLLGALRERVDWFDRNGLPSTLEAPAALPALPAAVELAAYRIVTEALANVARHAHAGHAVVTVSAGDGLCIDVQDDDPGAAGAGQWRPGVGLQSMAERAAEVGGALQVGPTPTGGRVHASLPLEPV
jgi:two-component system NarL family sensor kinase